MKSKWLIRFDKEMSKNGRRKYWENIHRQHNYENVFSITEDAGVRNRIKRVLLDNVRSVLIPGCGSQVFLQKDLVNQYNIKRIVCTDYKAVVEMAQKRFAHKKISYLAKDSTKLAFRNKFDAVVIVNSAVSESDAENRKMLRSCWRSLKKGGALVGYFPTIFCAVDIGLIDPQTGIMKRVCLEKSMFYEEKQKQHQIFYTPLRLRCILKEAGFKLGRMEICFFDSKYFQKEGSNYYGLGDKDLVIYGLFVVATK